MRLLSKSRVLARLRSVGANLVWYAHRQKWMLLVPLIAIKCIGKTSKSGFNKPIFMVGLQGAGETIIARVLSRSPQIVSVSGGHKFWFAADEMHSVMGPILPAPFTGQLHKAPRLDLFGRRRGWAYASDALLPYYKFGRGQISKNEADRFKFALSVIQAFSPSARILDKSQSYALKIPAIREILSDSDPRFVAVIRNPYASIYRAATSATHLSRERKSLYEKIRIAAEHWNNTADAIREALEEDSSDILVLRVEDVLQNFDVELKSIFEFLEIDFEDSFLPSHTNGMPWWAKRRERWYPVIAENNDKYLTLIPPEIKSQIEDVVSRNARWFGY